MKPTTKVKAHEWLLCRPNGEWERWRLPRQFWTEDVRRHAVHSDVFVRIPKRFVCYTIRGKVNGPTWCYVRQHDGELVDVGERDPRTIPHREYWSQDEFPAVTIP